MILVTIATYNPPEKEPETDIPPEIPFDQKAYDLSKHYGHPYNQLWLKVCKDTNYCTKVPKYEPYKPEPVVVPEFVPVKKIKVKKEKEWKVPRYTGFSALRHRCIGHIPSLQRAVQIKRGY